MKRALILISVAGVLASASTALAEDPVAKEKERILKSAHYSNRDAELAEIVTGVEVLAGAMGAAATAVTYEALTRKTALDNRAFSYPSKLTDEGIEKTMKAVRDFKPASHPVVKGPVLVTVPSGPYVAGTMYYDFGNILGDPKATPNNGYYDTRIKTYNMDTTTPQKLEEQLQKIKASGDHVGKITISSFDKSPLGKVTFVGAMAGIVFGVERIVAAISHRENPGLSYCGPEVFCENPGMLKRLVSSAPGDAYDKQAGARAAVEALDRVQKSSQAH